ncbi:MAG: ribose-phosphate diphosphokinase [Thermoplasmatota archaeon]
MPLVVAGSASAPFAAGLARELGATVARAEAKRFPDGEGYVRILEPVQGRDCVVVQATAPDTNLVELLLWQDALREAGARTVTTVIPYLGYARQDRVFHEGEAVSARAAARAVAGTTDAVVTVDPHKEEVLAFFGGKARSVSAVPQIAAELSRWGVDIVRAPDKGARDRAAQAAKLMGARVDHLGKTRISATEVTMQAKELDVAGARVAIVDDLIASGGTMVTAARQLKAQGAASVVAACTHGLFTGGAVPRLLAGGIDRVLATDTVEGGPCEIVSAAPAVADALRTRLTA